MGSTRYRTFKMVVAVLKRWLYCRHLDKELEHQLDSFKWQYIYSCHKNQIRDPIYSILIIKLEGENVHKRISIAPSNSIYIFINKMNSTTLRLMLYTITTTRMKIIIDLSSWICYSTDRLDISCQAPQGKVSFSFVFLGLARNLDQSLRHRCCISILNYFLLLWFWIGWINTYLKYLIYRSTASIRDCVIYTHNSFVILTV